MSVRQRSLASMQLNSLAPTSAAEWLDSFRRDVLDRYSPDCKIAIEGRYDVGTYDRAACLRDAKVDAPTTPEYTAESVERYWREICADVPCAAVLPQSTLASYDRALDGLLAFYQARGVAAPRVGRTIEARSVDEIRAEISDLINRYIEAGGKPPSRGGKGWLLLVLGVVGVGIMVYRS